MQPQLGSDLQTQSKSNKYAHDLYRLYASGLIVVSLIFLQGFLNLGSFDLPALISVLAFSAALPLLSAIPVLDIIEKRFRSHSRHVGIHRMVRAAFVFGVLLDVVGIGVALWHLVWFAGVAFVVSLLVTFVICGIYILSLDEDVECS